ncbi:putative trehalose synthase [Peziza echinospora]|nr:putative trehalose synthase [Peziza echinospora]
MPPHSLADEREGFASQPAYETRRRMSKVEEKQNWGGLSFTPMFAGVAVMFKPTNVIEVGICIHDGTYSTDYCIYQLSIPEGASPADRESLTNTHVLKQLRIFSDEHCLKFVGAGVTEKSLEIAPGLPAAMWREMDIVTMAYNVQHTAPRYGLDPDEDWEASTEVGAMANMGGGVGYDALDKKHERIQIDVDEQADSAVRKCIKDFGPGGNPSLSIGFRNQVEPDTGGRCRLVANLEEYKRTLWQGGEGSWNTMIKYAKDLRNRKIKIAFFSSTPQGGGVALMRHALLRFFRLAGVHATWYVPKPNPRVFRITKTNHNILQGVASQNVRLTDHQKKQIDEWITSNAQRSWLSPGGPLSCNGADIVIIDDPQMPGLIPLIKKARPEVPIIYRSHIEIRSDLVAVPGSPQAEVWEYLWNNIKLADVFISHPMESFVPKDVPMHKVGLMPACTDWLDGLNKVMREWDLRYYHHNFRVMCIDIHMSKLQYPQRDYIIQVARFDPSKGIPDVIDSFCKLRKRLDEELPYRKTPQLLICGHGAVDDPDASLIYDDMMKLLEQGEYAHCASDIILMRIGPSDQLLNALMTNAKIALQLSTREGFEVKVSEALHHGKPIVATRAGGIPLQVQHGKNGFLVDTGDTPAVANHLYDLWMDPALYKRMSNFARVSVSDEVGTVGNAISWLYLASKLSSDVEKSFTPNARWINDIARDEAGEPYKEEEPRLPRIVFTHRAMPIKTKESTPTVICG